MLLTSTPLGGLRGLLAEAFVFSKALATGSVTAVESARGRSTLS
jgi:hypothetical protein